jgi:electron transfer flavoprotein alpha subunit
MIETKVLVFSENNNLLLEILSKGREIADTLQTKVATVLLGEKAGEKAEDLIKHGADTVYIVENQEPEQFQIEEYLSILHRITNDIKPEIILISSTKNGKNLAAKLATRLNAGCMPDCSKLSINNEGKIIGERITYGGNAIAKVALRGKPQLITIPPKAFEKSDPKERKGQIVKLNIKKEAAKTEILETKPFEVSNVKIEDAEIIVSCGRGIEKQEDTNLLKDLAEIIGGQVGNTRPLAEDRKWFTDWVGLSGHKVSPKLYIACGISGIIQHMAGIRDSKTIVAINKDPEAPIFEVADYGVVGDLYEVLPALIKALKKNT